MSRINYDLSIEQHKEAVQKINETMWAVVDPGSSAGTRADITNDPDGMLPTSKIDSTLKVQPVFDKRDLIYIPIPSIHIDQATGNVAIPAKYSKANGSPSRAFNMLIMASELLQQGYAREIGKLNDPINIAKFANLIVDLWEPDSADPTKLSIQARKSREMLQKQDKYMDVFKNYGINYDPNFAQLVFVEDTLQDSAGNKGNFFIAVPHVDYEDRVKKATLQPNNDFIIAGCRF